MRTAGKIDANPTMRPAFPWLPEAALLTVVCMWAATFVMTKAILLEVSPLAFSSFRFALTIVIALATAAVSIRQAGALDWHVRRADLPTLAAAGLTGYCLYQLGFIFGVERTSAFSSSLMIAMNPLITIVVLALIGERTPARGWVGVGVALAGVVLFLADKRGSPGTLLGDALSLLAGVSFSVYGVISRPLVRGYANGTFTVWTVVLGCVPLVLLGVPAVAAQDWSAISPLVWGLMLWMSVMPVYVAYQLWNYGIAHRGAAQATSFNLLVPIFGGVLSAIFTQEAFGPLKLLGAALVLAGLVLPRLTYLAWLGRGPSASVNMR